jgi:uncharacterized RDD family membrane protein YckC
MLFGSKNAAPAPCPACDAPVDLAAGGEAQPSCPVCGQRLVPVRVAGFWRRSVAALVDAAILLLTAGPLFYGLTRATANPGPLRGGLTLDGLLQFLAVDPLDILLWLAPLLGMAALYFILFIALSGRTPGQKLVGIRVINRAGGPPGPWRAMLRLAGTALGLAPGGLGSLWMAFDREKRAFHDYLTGTYVVREH